MLADELLLNLSTNILVVKDAELQSRNLPTA